MIQIQEKDALWRFYKRYYTNMAIPPDPGNLCNYFWKSMGGAFKTLFWDINPFVPTLVFAGLTVLLWLWQDYTGVFNVTPKSVLHLLGNIVAVLFFVASIGASAACALTCPTFRWFDYWSKKDERVCWVSGTILAVVGFAVIISMGFVGKNGPWHWYYLLYGLGIELALAVLIVAIISGWYFFFSDNTNLGKNILQYLGAIKSRACPLVQPPQSHQEAKREAELNCGDG